MSDRPFGFKLACWILGLALVSCRDKSTNPPAGKELDSPFLLGATTGSQNYVHTFGNEGDYPYHCILHTTAQHHEGGTVLVNSQGGDSAFVRIYLGAFDPATVTVRAGGHVRWQNFDDGVHHTVTSDS